MSEQWTTHIKAQTGLFELNIGEVKKYRDLIFLFVKRNFTTRYKQTILGPLWLLFTPLITVLMHSIVFGNIAGMGTDGSPQLLFYMTSNAIWSYFSLCLTQTANTFTSNANIFGKVYFPRIIVPISTIITGLLDFLIQMAMLVIMIVIYGMMGIKIYPTGWVFLTPLIVIQTAILGMGCGIIISSVTTKYRDLTVLVGFGMQLWMYASPTVYGLGQIPVEYRSLYLLNPMAPIIVIWRYAILGTGELPLKEWGCSWIITAMVLFFGVILFNKVEKNFMDTV